MDGLDSFDVTPSNNVSVTTADVSGFTEVKYTGSMDYLFIVDVLWSDGRSMSVKRTYKDFLSFRKILVDHFQSDSKGAKENGPVFIPNLAGLYFCVWFIFSSVIINLKLFLSRYIII